MHINKRIISHILLASLIFSNVVDPFVSFAESFKKQSTIEEMQEEGSVSGTLTGEQILEDMKNNETKTEEEQVSEEAPSNNEEVEEEQVSKEEVAPSDNEEVEEVSEEVENSEYEVMPLGIYDNAYDYYNTYSSKLIYNDGYFYYGTRNTAATTSITYRTIGYQVTIEKDYKIFYDRLLIGGTLKQLHRCTVGSYVYNLYRMDIYNGESLISRMKSRHGYASILDSIIDPGQVTEFEFNPISTCASNGVATGTLNSDGTISGEIYLTANGVSSVEIPSGWSLIYPSGYSWSLATSYDTKTGYDGYKGLNGARQWSANARTQQRNSFNLRTSITGLSIPVDRYISVRYIAEDTGAILGTAGYNTTLYGALSSVYVATPSFANRQVSYTKIYNNNSLVEQYNVGSSGFNATVRKMVSVQQVDVYYKLMLKDINVTISHYVHGTNTKVYPDQTITVYGVGTSGKSNRFYAQNTNEYKTSQIDIYKNGSHQQAIALNGDSYRDVHISYDGNSHHINFHYKRSIPSDTAGSGSISFNPASTGWVNSNINVTVTATGTTRITKYGTANRTLYYGTHVTVPSTTVEVWEVDKLYVWGSGLSANNAGVNYNSGNYSNGATFTISQESKQGELGAKVNSWKRVSTSWLHSYPVSSSAVYSVTSAPTYTYETYSKVVANGGTYNLDKTAPNLSVDKNSSNWTNQNVTVTLSASDALSGLKSSSSTVRIQDSSVLSKATKSYSDFTGSSKSYTLSEDGIWTIYSQRYDNAGNSNSITTGQFKVDKTAPNNATFTKDNRTYADDPLTVTVTVGDNLSGISEVKYVVNNSATDRTGTLVNANITTTENSTQTKTFNVSLNNAGSYYIHVYIKDRAGNEKWTTSQNYKVIKFSTNDVYVYPRTKGVRGSRFDVLVGVYGVINSEISSGKVNVNITNLPNWFDDDVNKKTNNVYSVTSGTKNRLLKLYAAKSTGNQSVSTSTSKTMVYESTVIPFGTPCTIDRDGNRIKAQERFTISLTIDPTYYNVTQVRPINLYYDIVPEVQLKTEIINNEF